jgi:hypothetical protein
MVLVLFNWIYILLVSFCLGFLLKKIVCGVLRYNVGDIDVLLFAGLAIATIYAQVFSLFYKVGLVANIVVSLVSVTILLIWHGEILGFLKSNVRGVGIGKKILTAILIIIWAYCTSRGNIHYDSDLYHAQAIRWIEEYGVVKGLGNIHVRFAYNSSFFALQALYSMKFLVGKSLHAVNGFIALILSLEVANLVDIPKKKRINISDFARLGAFFYLTLIYDDVVSPATDYTIMCIVFYIVIKWLVLLEKKEKSYVPYSLICVACVYAVSVKLTAGVILILLIKPACMLVRGKHWKEIAIFILMGVVTIAPWFARNIVISGYLIYPYPSIDIFNVDWKIPEGVAAYDAAEIKAWGRGLFDSTLVTLKIYEWFPQWFSQTLDIIPKLAIILDIACIFVLVVLVVITFARKLKIWDELLVLCAVVASYIFWQIQAPLLRYGYAYVILTIVVTAGILWDKILVRNCKYVLAFTKILSSLIIILVALKTVSLIRYMYTNIWQPYYIIQKPYNEYELDSYEVNGVTFYYSVDGDRVGYDKFPSIPTKVDIVFRGSDITEGFKPN